MKVTVKLFATFREGREKFQVMEVTESTTPENIISALKIDKAEIAILLINGRDGKMDRQLEEGDVVAIFPPVGGG